MRRAARSIELPPEEEEGWPEEEEAECEARVEEAAAEVESEEEEEVYQSCASKHSGVSAPVTLQAAVERKKAFLRAHAPPHL